MRTWLYSRAWAPAACPSSPVRFCSFASFPIMLLSAQTSLSRLCLVQNKSECACIFGAFPLQRLSSSQSPLEQRRSCQCLLWLKTTALILRRIRTAILTDFPANTHTHTLHGFVACVAPGKEILKLMESPYSHGLGNGSWLSYWLYLGILVCSEGVEFKSLHSCILKYNN